MSNNPAFISPFSRNLNIPRIIWLMVITFPLRGPLEFDWFWLVDITNIPPDFKLQTLQDIPWDAAPLTPSHVRRKACKDAPRLHHSSCTCWSEAPPCHWQAPRIPCTPRRNEHLQVSTWPESQMLQTEMHVTFPSGTWSTCGGRSGTVARPLFVPRRQTVSPQTELEDPPTYCYWWEW